VSTAIVPLATLAALAAVAWGALKLRAVVDVACGYKSKVLCTGIFASGRDMDPRRAV
jgi:hypothetical protein